MTACPAFPLRAWCPAGLEKAASAKPQRLSAGAQSRDSFGLGSLTALGLSTLPGARMHPRGWVCVCVWLLAAPGSESRPRPLPLRQPPACLDFSKPFGAVSLLGPRLETSALLFVKQSLFIQITAGKSQDLQDPWTFVGSLHYFCMNKTSSFPVLDPSAGAPHRASSPFCPQTFSVLRMCVKVSTPGAGVHRQAWAVSPCPWLQDPAHFPPPRRRGSAWAWDLSRSLSKRQDAAAPIGSPSPHRDPAVPHTLEPV